MDHEMIPFSFFILSCSDLKKKITTSLRTIDAFRKKNRNKFRLAQNCSVPSDVHGETVKYVPRSKGDRA